MKTENKKFLTFSFDDGVEDDVRMVELLNRYGLKATFNLNSGKLTGCSGLWMYNGTKAVRSLNAINHLHLYDGHEIASHTCTHPHLEELTEETLYTEIALDKLILSRLYETEVSGLATPFGTYNDHIEEVAAACGMCYCRTIDSTHAFDFPTRVLLHPTCHYKDADRMDLARRFVEAKPEKPMLFYVWGHSYEMVTEEDWQGFEEFCRFLANRDDITYCTNIEAVKRG